MVSAFMVLSDAVRLKYPFVAAITSILPVVDEFVAVINPYDGGETREVLEKEFAGIRLVPGLFDLNRYGWISYGIAQTTGYQACRGDVVMLCSGDGVLHEKDVDELRKQLKDQLDRPGHPFAYWDKNRFYGPTLYYDQHKHSGIYTKKFLGDRFHFYHGRYKGIPNTSERREDEKFRNIGITLFGYEHLWDTEEVIREKVNNYGRMIDQATNKPFKTPKVYYREYVKHLVDRLKRDGKKMSIDKQPKVMHELLNSVSEEHFGLNCFGNR